MGLPLGLTLSNFYMNHIENKNLNNFIKPFIYVLCTDDIILLMKFLNKIKTLKETFEKNSTLHFTY